jgi:hypothetical protein
MKRALLFAAMAVGVMAIPSSASAVSDCNYAAGSPATVGPVTVYGPADSRTGDGAGACADGLGVAGIDGGYVEAGAGDVGQAYVIVDGSDANVDPVVGTTPDNSQSDGYIGVSTYESQPDAGAACPPDNGTNDGTNSGGCFAIDSSVPVVGGQSVPGVPVACGNTSGNDWAATSRDGCSIP